MTTSYVLRVCDSNGQPWRVYEADAADEAGARDEARRFAAQGYVGGHVALHVASDEPTDPLVVYERAASGVVERA